jgi:cation transport ATPase
MRTLSTPLGIYVVAVVFLVAGLLCVAELFGVMLTALGVASGASLASMNWLLPGYVVGLCLVCYGVFFLIKLHPAPQWVMFGMTFFLTVQLTMAPAGDSPFYSAPRIYFNRMLLVLPLIASCAYLARPAFRQASREFRAAHSPKPKA